MMQNYYPYFLSLHIISVISWMAAILYIYRLYVYHAGETEPVVKDRFCYMEKRLMRFILIPGMALTLFFGILMVVANPVMMHQKWLLLKLGFVAGLMYLSHFAGRLRRQLGEGRCRFTPRQLRFLNEVPTILMIIIVFLAVLKP